MGVLIQWTGSNGKGVAVDRVYWERCGSGEGLLGKVWKWTGSKLECCYSGQGLMGKMWQWTGFNGKDVAVGWV